MPSASGNQRADQSWLQLPVPVRLATREPIAGLPPLRDFLWLIPISSGRNCTLLPKERFWPPSNSGSIFTGQEVD
jgi:hypothetical protein